MRAKTVRWAAFGLVLALVTSGRAANDAPPPASSSVPSFGGFSLTSKKEPIQITSQKLEFDYKSRLVVFRDDVEVVQGEVHLQSDVLRVEYVQVADKQQLQTATADGHVRITQGAKKASGKHAVFDQSSRTMVLTGDAVLEEGSNQVSGDKIVVYPDDSRMEVLGQNRRVKVVLFPGQGPLADGATGKPTPNAGSGVAAGPAPTPSPGAHGAAQGS